MLAQQDQPLTGSRAERKLDIGIVEGPQGLNQKNYDWSDIQVIGEPKSNAKETRRQGLGVIWNATQGRYSGFKTPVASVWFSHFVGL